MVFFFFHCALIAGNWVGLLVLLVINNGGVGWGCYGGSAG